MLCLLLCFVVVVVVILGVQYHFVISLFYVLYLPESTYLLFVFPGNVTDCTQNPHTSQRCWFLQCLRSSALTWLMSCCSSNLLVSKTFCSFTLWTHPLRSDIFHIVHYLFEHKCSVTPKFSCQYVVHYMYNTHFSRGGQEKVGKDITRNEKYKIRSSTETIGVSTVDMSGHDMKTLMWDVIFRGCTQLSISVDS